MKSNNCQLSIENSFKEQAMNFHEMFAVILLIQTILSFLLIV